MGLFGRLSGKTEQEFDCGCGAKLRTKEELMAHAQKVHAK